MTHQASQARLFLELHYRDSPLLLPNPWDIGSAKLFASLGFKALATTSSGHAATLGRLDGGVTRDEALSHAAAIVSATELPVSADLENCYAHEPPDVAETAHLAAAVGLAGLSIEDFTGEEADPIYEISTAAARVQAVAAAAHEGPTQLVVTARAENYLHDRPDLRDTIARLQAFEAAGADVLYAPGVTKADDIRQIVGSVDLPVNVLALPGTPPVDALAQLGVKRISVGGAFSLAGIDAVATAAREFLEQGSYDYWTAASRAVKDRDNAFRS